MCECIGQINEKLETQNAALNIPTLIDMNTGKTRPGTTVIAVYKIDPKKRGRLPTLMARFCPFCGAEAASE